MNDYAAFYRRMAEMERNATRGNRGQRRSGAVPAPAWENTPEAQAQPQVPRLSPEDVRQLERDNEVENARQRARREYSPLGDEWGPVVPITAMIGDLAAAPIDAAGAVAGDPAARRRRDERTTRWRRGERQAGEDILAEGHGGQLMDWASGIGDDLADADRARVEAGGEDSLRARLAAGAAGLWTGMAAMGRDARGEVAAEDVRRAQATRDWEAANARGQEAFDRGDMQGAGEADIQSRSIARTGQEATDRGDAAAGMDFWANAPWALEFTPGGLVASTVRAPARLGLRAVGAEVPEALARPRLLSETQRPGVRTGEVNPRTGEDVLYSATGNAQGWRNNALLGGGAYLAADSADGNIGDDPGAALMTAGGAMALGRNFIPNIDSAIPAETRQLMRQGEMSSDGARNYTPRPRQRLTVDPEGRVAMDYEGSFNTGDGASVGETRSVIRGAREALDRDIADTRRSEYSWTPNDERQAALYRNTFERDTPTNYAFSETPQGEGQPLQRLRRLGAQFEPDPLQAQRVPDEAPYGFEGAPQPGRVIDAEATPAPQRRFEAAVRDPETGQVYTGQDHVEAIDSAPEAARARLQALYDAPTEDPNAIGFLVDGQFMGREEGMAALRERAERRPVRIGEQVNRDGSVTPASPIDWENGSNRLPADDEWFNTLAGRPTPPRMNIVPEGGVPGRSADDMLRTPPQAADPEALSLARSWVDSFGGGPEAEARAISVMQDHLSRAGHPAWRQRLQAAIDSIGTRDYVRGEPTMHSRGVEEAWPEIYGATRAPDGGASGAGNLTDAPNAGPRRLGDDATAALLVGGGAGAVAGAAMDGQAQAQDGTDSNGVPLLPILGAGAGAATFAALRRGRLGQSLRSQTGMFAGVNARTADRAALARAQEMATQGASRDAIWNETGWFQGVDGKWRFEIDDSGASVSMPERAPYVSELATQYARENFGVNSIIDIPVNDVRRQEAMQWAQMRAPSIAEQRAQSWPLNEVLDHPEMRAAYGMDDVSFGREMEPGLQGSYNPTARRVRATDESAWLSGPDADPRSTVLHEVQHHTQEVEDFARGGDPRGVFQGEIDRINARMSALVREQDTLRSIINGGNTGVDVAPYAARLEEVKSEYRALMTEREALADPNARRDAYRRLAGETEARNVQTRRDFTPEERRSRPPWETQDVPDDQQIVRFDGDRAESRPEGNSAMPRRRLGQAGSESRAANVTADAQPTANAEGTAREPGSMLTDSRLNRDQNYAASRALDGLSPRAIAEEMDTTAAYVRVLLAKARALAPDLEIPRSVPGRALDGLTERARALRAQGLSYEEIGDQLNMSPTAVKSRVNGRRAGDPLDAIAPLAIGGGAAALAFGDDAEARGDEDIINRSRYLEARGNEGEETPRPPMSMRLGGAIGAGLIVRNFAGRLGARGVAQEIPGMATAYGANTVLGGDPNESAIAALSTPAVRYAGEEGGRRLGQALEGHWDRQAARSLNWTEYDHNLNATPAHEQRVRDFAMTLPGEITPARSIQVENYHADAPRQGRAPVSMGDKEAVREGYYSNTPGTGEMSPRDEFLAMTPSQQEAWMDRQSFRMNWMPEGTQERVAQGRDVQARAMEDPAPPPPPPPRGMPPMNRQTRGERTAANVQRRAGTRPAGQTLDGFIEAAGREGVTIRPEGKSVAARARAVADAIRNNPRLEQLARDWGLAVLLTAGGVAALSANDAEASDGSDHAFSDPKNYLTTLAVGSGALATGAVVANAVRNPARMRLGQASRVSEIPFHEPAPPLLARGAAARARARANASLPFGERTGPRMRRLMTSRRAPEVILDGDVDPRVVAGITALAAGPIAWGTAELLDPTTRSPQEQESSFLQNVMPYMEMRQQALELHSQGYTSREIRDIDPEIADEMLILEQGGNSLLNDYEVSPAETPEDIQAARASRAREEQKRNPQRLGR